MPEQALYLKWRPLSFDELVGQEHIRRTLLNAMRSDRIRHAYLFSGPRGTGKTTTARLLAKAVNCIHPDPAMRPCNQCSNCIAVNEGRFLDLIEIDAATHTGVDDVRDLRDKIAFAPGEGRYKVYIIDEVHRFSGSAFDALLKTLEEPPEHALFVLATTEIDKVPPTIKSRCLQFEFRRLSVKEVADRLQEIVESEGMTYEREALEMIARQGTGSARDSISLLDQIVTDPDEPITVLLVQNVLGTASSVSVRELVDAMIEGDAATGLRVIHQAIDSGTDPRQFGQQVVEYVRCVLLAQTAGAETIEASDDERDRYAQQASEWDKATLIRTLHIFNDAVNQYKGGWQPQLTLELALVDALRGADAAGLAPVTMPAVATPSRPAHALPPSAIDDSAEPMPLPPGASPLVPLAVVRERWNQILRTMGDLNKMSPDVMQNFQPIRVEGNVVVLATTSKLFYDRIYPHPDKQKIVIRAMQRVLNEHLRVQVTLVESLDAPDNGVQPRMNVNDPLLSTGMELGAKITPLE